MSRKILYIHHGTAHGGAPLSLLYTAIGAKKAGYEVMVGLASPAADLRDLYAKNDIATVDCSWLSVFHYSTVAPMPLTDLRSWLFYFKHFRKWRRSQKNLLKLVESERIDIVHLNSMALINSAIVLQKRKLPFVWHVREPAINYRSVRGKFVSRYLLKSDAVIFISKEDQQSWLGERADHGTVIHNFIDFASFGDQHIKAIAQEQKGKLDPGALVILYVGGLSEVKGVVPLLLALHQLKMKKIPFYCLMPGSLNIQSSNVFKRFVQERILKNFSCRAEKLISLLDLGDNLIRGPFDPDIRVKFAMADVLVFPSIRRHFARPIVEAAAMERPVIASDFPGTRELVDEGKSGFLVEPNNAQEIADKLLLLFHDKEMRAQMGRHAFHWGKQRFDTQSQIRKILSVYEKLQ